MRAYDCAICLKHYPNEDEARKHAGRVHMNEDKIEAVSE